MTEKNLKFIWHGCSDEVFVMNQAEERPAEDLRITSLLDGEPLENGFKRITDGILDE